MEDTFHETILIKNSDGVQDWLCFFCGHHRRFDKNGMTIVFQGNRDVPHIGNINGIDEIIQSFGEDSV